MTRATRIHTIFAASGKLNIAMKQMIFTNAAHPELHYTARDYTKPVNSFPLTNNISSRVAIHKVMRLLLVTLRHQAHVIVHSARSFLRPLDFALLLLLEDILMADIKPVDPQ